VSPFLQSCTPCGGGSRPTLTPGGSPRPRPLPRSRRAAAPVRPAWSLATPPVRRARTLHEFSRRAWGRGLNGPSSYVLRWHAPPDERTSLDARTLHPARRPTPTRKDSMGSTCQPRRSRGPVVAPGVVLGKSRASPVEVPHTVPSQCSARSTGPAAPHRRALSPCPLGPLFAQLSTVLPGCSAGERGRCAVLARSTFHSGLCPTLARSPGPAVTPQSWPHPSRPPPRRACLDSGPPCVLGRETRRL
jgi:hypothetical protein